MRTLADVYGVTTYPPASWPSSGHSAPTPAPPVVISEPDGILDYCAFPSLTVDGTTLHLIYQRRFAHTGTDGQVIYQTKPLNGSWSDPEFIYDAGDVGEFVSVGGLSPTVLPNGDVLAIIATVVNASDLRTPWIRIRHDGVWSNATVLTSDFAGGQVTSGANVAIWDTTIVHPMYARSSGSLRGVYLYEANMDAPTVWTQRCEVVAPGARNNDWEEPGIVRRSDGLAIMLIRDDNTDSQYMSWSPDLSRWSWPVYAFAGVAKSDLGINPYDDMLCINRDPVTIRAVFSFSGDSGLTWTPIEFVDDNPGAMQYGSVVWVPGRGWVGVYSVTDDPTGQPGEYNGPAVLYEVEFT